MSAARLRLTSWRHSRRRADARWGTYRDEALGPGWRTGWPEGSEWQGDREWYVALTTQPLVEGGQA